MGGVLTTGEGVGAWLLPAGSGSDGLADNRQGTRRLLQLVVRSLDEEIVQALKLRAGRRGRSAEAEHRDILRAALLSPRSGKSLKALLLEIPAVGDDSDFARPQDLGEVD